MSLSNISPGNRLASIGRTVAANNYGKGFSLVLRRSEIPSHADHVRLELSVVRTSSPEKEFRLYARDGKNREVHFVITRLQPKKGELFLVQSVKTVGVAYLVKEYSRNKPDGLENTRLRLGPHGVTIEIDGVDVELGRGKLEAYGTNLAYITECPKEFSLSRNDRGKFAIVKGLDGFMLRVTGGLRITSLRRIGERLIPSLKIAHPFTEPIEGVKGRRGFKIRLENIEDRAWLGGLTVGEGSFFARASRTKSTLDPCLEIAMQDDQAIEKASHLMGVRRVKGEYSDASGKFSWRVMAVGARMIDIFEAIKPFLTSTKIKQAEVAIERAQESGFLTKRQMREKRKGFLLMAVLSRPGLSTRELGIKLGIGYSYALAYLRELEKGGKLFSRKSGTKRRLRLLWFPNSLENRESKRLKEGLHSLENSGTRIAPSC
jgi:hypothetical protein